MMRSCLSLMLASDSSVKKFLAAVLTEWSPRPPCEVIGTTHLLWMRSGLSHCGEAMLKWMTWCLQFELVSERSEMSLWSFYISKVVFLFLVIVVMVVPWMVGNEV